ncbi:hypothetical protein EDD16DRAFT_1526216 [Pisolithus croceorrhizus]|nr:hypothetical protein EDD16DRAFT_1526216 [Pisolithus croceorrhizus]KAI6122825.1 hypothetical protein EV401DRAFT_2165835 [Pisolithus croceorrhizus]KAI6165054.1 hypothetical protein EDD17DRAFT_1506385 [Pisolithus thermaeus]
MTCAVLSEYLQRRELVLVQADPGISEPPRSFKKAGKEGRASLITQEDCRKAASDEGRCNTPNASCPTNEHSVDAASSPTVMDISLLPTRSDEARHARKIDMVFLDRTSKQETLFSTMVWRALIVALTRSIYENIYAAVSRWNLCLCIPRARPKRALSDLVCTAGYLDVSLWAVGIGAELAGRLLDAGIGPAANNRSKWKFGQSIKERKRAITTIWPTWGCDPNMSISSACPGSRAAVKGHETGAVGSNNLNSFSDLIAGSIDPMVFMEWAECGL